MFQLVTSFAHSDTSQGAFEDYTARYTCADVLREFADTSLPPFECLVSMIPVNTPRLYSISSSPLHRKNRLDLLVVQNKWTDPNKMNRIGLTTRYLICVRKAFGDLAGVRRVSRTEHQFT
jgi:sulfite reductase alpha subunit-like flavoprotein